MTADTIATHITAHQRRLTLLAYRMTGSMALAEDISQEVFIKLHLKHASLSDPDELAGWLTTLTINLSRDALRHRQSRAYIGPWLPEPLLSPEPEDARSPADRLLGMEALGYGLLCLFESLTPTQRAVLLLRELCEYSTGECARALDMTTSNVKTTLHRAKNLLGPRTMSMWHAPTMEARDRHTEAVGRLLTSLMTGDTQAVEALLCEDVELYNDAGGEFVAALRPIRSVAHVLRFMMSKAPGHEAIRDLKLVECNGLMTVHLHLVPDGPRSAPRVIIAVQCRQDEAGEAHIEKIYQVSATTKLGALSMMR